MLGHAKDDHYWLVSVFFTVELGRATVMSGSGWLLPLLLLGVAALIRLTVSIVKFACLVG